MRERPKRLIYRVWRERSGERDIDHLWVGEYDEVSAAERLAGTVDNKDGYNSNAPDGGAETAVKMGRVFAAMLRDGHETFYDWSYGSWTFSVRYQVYQEPGDGPLRARPHYCDPRVEFPDKIAGAKWVLKLIDKIGRKVERERAKKRKAETGNDYPVRDVSDRSLEQLQDVVAALGAVGAVRVDWWTGPAEGWYVPLKYHVPVKKKCAGCGEYWPCSDSERRDIRGEERAKHSAGV